MVGLGRMGGNMVRRLIKHEHELIVSDLNAETVAQFAGDGAIPSKNLADLVGQLQRPRAVWIMVPAGEATETTVNQIAELLEPGDIIIDGGNSHFKDDIRRATVLQEQGIRYLDVGTSGGVWGAERGYCLMIGGDETAFKHTEPIFKTLAPGTSGIAESKGRENLESTAPEGYLYCGKAGAGHFVKMVHNGIEYGLMHAYAEGFDILKNAAFEKLPEARRYDLNLADITELWRRGSVVSSWLLDLTAISLAENPDLSSYSGFVQDSGEGRWTIEAAIEEEVSADVLAASLFARFRSRKDHTFAEKIISAMRKQFGGHLEPPKATSHAKVGEAMLMSGEIKT